MQVEKTEVVPEAQLHAWMQLRLKPVSSISAEAMKHLYSLSLKQLEDAKKEIHKELSYPIRHTF